MGGRAAVVFTGAAITLAACGARPAMAPSPQLGDQIALYRDRAVVIQRVELIAASAGVQRAALQLPPDVEPGDVVVVDRGELAGATLHAAGAAGAVGDPAPHPPSAAPRDAELEATAPRAGRFALRIAYATGRLHWQAAYTMTTAPARDRAAVRGELAIDNATGLVFHARVQVVDGDLGSMRDVTLDQLRAVLAGGPALPRDAEPRELGPAALATGEVRLELLAAAPRALRSVLVYDPIGRELDHAGSVPISDPRLGAAAAPARVTESFEIDRDPRASRGLPAGPVRLLERRPDGSLELLGESRLFGAATQVADVDTIAIGTAQGVTGHRERRDWGKDDELRRFSEEFLVTIDNARPRPIELVLREHLYRGQNWTLAYQSVPAVKEGPQQIALRATVPANGRAKVLYVVVYTW